MFSLIFAIILGEYTLLIPHVWGVFFITGVCDIILMSTACYKWIN